METKGIPRQDNFDGFICDSAVKTRITDCVTSAKLKCSMPPHMLLTGAHGTGKNTIAGIIARTLNVPLIKFPGADLREKSQMSVLFDLPEYGGILFVEEIHAVSKEVVEILCPIMEDGFMTSFGDPKLNIYLNSLMVIGATTEPASLVKSLRGRFVVKIDLKPYTTPQMRAILDNMVSKFSGETFTTESLDNIAQRCKFTPQIAENLLRQISDAALAHNVNSVDRAFSDKMFEVMNIDQDGLDNTDREILTALKTNTVLDLSSLAARVNIDEASLTESYEPYLIQKGYLVRNKTERKLTEKGRQFVGQ